VITNAKVRIFQKQALTALASSNLEVADRLLGLTARELARKQDHLFLLLSTTAEERIICFLIEMVERASPREDDVIDLEQRTTPNLTRLIFACRSRTALRPHVRQSSQSARTNCSPRHCALAIPHPR
jgi:CRP-like cAMP-binding protein